MTTTKESKKGIEEIFNSDGRLICRRDSENSRDLCYGLDGEVEEIRSYSGGSLSRVEKFCGGAKTYDCTYVNGVKNGTEIVYGHSGCVSSETNYVNGKMDGVSVSYFDNGAKLSESHWKNGNRHGISMRYSFASREDDCKNDKKYLRQIQYFIDGKEVTLDEHASVFGMSEEDTMLDPILVDKSKMSKQLLRNGYVTYALSDHEGRVYGTCNSLHMDFHYHINSLGYRFYWSKVFVYFGKVTILSRMSLINIPEEEYKELLEQSKVNLSKDE